MGIFRRGGTAVRGLGLLVTVGVTFASSVGTTASPASAMTVSLTPTARYVTTMYQDFLERNPSSAALGFWSTALASGSTTRAGFVSYLAFSDESFRLQVRTLYRDDLARDPSPAALAQRVKQLEDHQLTARQLDALLVSSDEVLAHFHLTTTQWVNWVYRARVGWTPTAAQLDRWVAAVAVHGRDYVANVFEQSPHARLTAVLHIEEQLIQRASTGASLAHWVNLDTDTSDLTVKAELAATGEAFAVATPVVPVPLSATSFDFTAGVPGDAVLAGYDAGYFTSTDLPAGLSLQEVVDHLTFSTHLVGTVATPGTYTAHVAIHAYPIPGSWVIATTTLTIHVAS